MDTLGHSSGGTIGLYSCHGSGGNQVKTLIHLELNTEQNLLSRKTFYKYRIKFIRFKISSHAGRDFYCMKKGP